MNTRKLSVILIAVAFSLITLFSCFAIFSVKEVEIDFAVDGDTDVTEIRETLESYLGKNLLFLKTDSVQEELEKYHYMEVLSIEKQYPNVLKVKVEERRETYYVEHGVNVYVTTAEGFVLNVMDKTEYQGNTERDKITLKIKDVQHVQGEEFVEQDAVVNGTAVGETLSIKDDDFLSIVFDLAKKVDLTDCIKKIKVERIGKGSVIEEKNIVINTHTGVTIKVKDAGNKGEEKIRKAFNKYEEQNSTDYQKMFDYILAYESLGETVAYWSPEGNTPIIA